MKQEVSFYKRKSQYASIKDLQLFEHWDWIVGIYGTKEFPIRSSMICIYIGDDVSQTFSSIEKDKNVRYYEDTVLNALSIVLQEDVEGLMVYGLDLVGLFVRKQDLMAYKKQIELMQAMVKVEEGQLAKQNLLKQIQNTSFFCIGTPSDKKVEQCIPIFLHESHALQNNPQKQELSLITLQYLQEIIPMGTSIIIEPTESYNVSYSSEELLSQMEESQWCI